MLDSDEVEGMPTFDFIDFFQSTLSNPLLFSTIKLRREVP